MLRLRLFVNPSTLAGDAQVDEFVSVLHFLSCMSVRAEDSSWQNTRAGVCKLIHPCPRRSGGRVRERVELTLERMLPPPSSK